MVDEDKTMIPIVTMVDLNYFPGLITLFESIVQKGNLPKEQKYIVIEAEELAEKDRDLIRKFDLNIEFRKQAEYSNACINWFEDWIRVNNGGLQWCSWIRKMLKKIYVFNMTEFEKLIFIDADIICMGDMNELFDMPHFSVRLDFADKQAMLFEYKQFNTGVMVVSPSRDDFDGIVKVLNENARDLLTKIPSSDQVIINYYFWKMKPEVVHLIDYKWGLSKRTIKNPEAFREHAKDIRLLHLVGFKPWWGSEDPIYQKLEQNWHIVWEQAKKRLNGGNGNGN